MTAWHTSSKFLTTRPLRWGIHSQLSPQKDFSQPHRQLTTHYTHCLTRRRLNSSQACLKKKKPALTRSPPAATITLNRPSRLRRRTTTKLAPRLARVPVQRAKMTRRKSVSTRFRRQDMTARTVLQRRVRRTTTESDERDEMKSDGGGGE